MNKDKKPKLNKDGEVIIVEEEERLYTETDIRNAMKSGNDYAIFNSLWHNTWEQHVEYYLKSIVKK